MDAAKLILSATPEFDKALAHLLSVISQIEWGGIIFYTKKGTFLDEAIEIELNHIELLDIGSVVDTEHDYDSPEFIEAVMKRENQPYGLIHSHHSGGVYYSSTDEEEIENNIGFYPQGYLSVVVNNKGHVLAKLSAEHEVTHMTYIWNEDKTAYREIKETGTHTVEATAMLRIFDKGNRLLRNRIKLLHQANAKEKELAKKYPSGSQHNGHRSGVPESVIPGQY